MQCADRAVAQPAGDPAPAGLAAYGVAHAFGAVKYDLVVLEDDRRFFPPYQAAAPVITAGVRTAAVITVGAATLAAFIGAGGLGEPIVTGLALADTRLVRSPPSRSTTARCESPRSVSARVR